jgi:4-carboxymuconolactone decarboxylase
LTDAVRALVRVSAAIGRGDRDAVARELAAAAAVAGRGQIEEMLLQSHLFVGYPAMLQAITAWHEIADDDAADDAAAGGVDEAAAGAVDERSAHAVTERSAHAVDDADDWPARGEWVCATIYGAQYERLRANVARLHPVLERWMIVDGYGRVLGRPGLPLAVRELCIVGLLCPQDVPDQLYAHLRGALNAGASVDDVEEAVMLAVVSLEAGRRAGVLARWEIVKSRTGD